MRCILTYILIPLLPLSMAGALYLSFHNSACLARIGTTPKTFIMTAFPSETVALEKYSSQKERCTYYGVVYTLAMFGNQEAVIFEGGVGPKKARDSAERTLGAFSVDMLLFSGIAGAIDADAFSIGETVIAQTWTELSSGRVEQTDSELVRIAGLQQSVHVVKSGVTATFFVTDVSHIPHGVAIVDMESHAVAQAAKRYDVPFLSIRSVSDYVGNGGDPEVALSSDASAKVVREFLEQAAHES
ncbi:MAG: 5'-methylthioadenosine/S-adenosylhomocysteine nucleosidase [Candidatus Pacebacteria bacterium]|nr:5'-methylthioadenosine/S-adenosylhomocysteine nucleosidase [Candidatus Paceibacterota bacterium]